jgi:toxin ParE1/3/4
VSRVFRRPGARQDLVEIVAHYLRAGSPATARRFREQAEAAFQRLAGMPGLGTRFEHDFPVLGELRFASLSPHFKLYLVFYRTTADGIEIVRVLHGARDLPGILRGELGIAGDPGDDIEQNTDIRP